MITKFKIFEADVYDTTKNYIFDDKYGFFIADVMDYLSITIEHPEDFVVIPVSKYNVDYIDFIKEIILNKNISFVSADDSANDTLSVIYPENKVVRIKGIIEKVSQLFVNEEYFIRVKIKGDTSLGVLGIGWHLINNFEKVFFIYPDKYDAEDKPLHKEMILKKETEKFNI